MVPSLFDARTGHVLLLLAVVVCGWHGARRLRALDPHGWRRARYGMLLVAISPWIGGHLHFVVNNWAWVTLNPSFLLTPWLGFHAGGAIICLSSCAVLVMHRYRLPRGRMADALVPTVAIGIVLGRLACFAEGCCFGRVCQWPWCVAFPPGSHPYEWHLAQGVIGATATRSAPVHALQLYFGAVGVVLLGLWRSLHPRRRYDGQVALIALLVFSAAAAVLEPLRAGDDARVYWGPLPQLLWTALGMCVISGAALVAAERRQAVR